MERNKIIIMKHKICFIVFFTLMKANSFTQNMIIGEELLPLNFLAGEWDVESDVRLSKQGPWEKSKARSVIKRAVGETIIEEEYTGTKQGHSFYFKSWLGNDNRTKLYQRVAVDSDHGVLILFEGKLENDSLTLHASLQLNEVHLLHKIQYLIISNEFFTIESFRSVDEGKTWDRTGTLKYTRRN